MKKVLYTQGDPSAMPMYSVSTRPLIDELAKTLDETTKQAWYADDSTASGKLTSLAHWWNMLTTIGPLFPARYITPKRSHI